MNMPVVVREGEASVAVTGGAQQILPGQTATLFGNGDVQADVNWVDARLIKK